MYCVSAHCHPPSPPDCLVLLVFKDKADKAQGSRERASVTLEEICGVEAGQWHDGVAFTLAVLCLNQAALLGFDSKDALQAWDARLRYSLGEGGGAPPVLLVWVSFPFRVYFIYLPKYNRAKLETKQLSASRVVHPSRLRPAALFGKAALS